jgi:hypothetical protein
MCELGRERWVDPASLPLLLITCASTLDPKRRDSLVSNLVQIENCNDHFGYTLQTGAHGPATSMQVDPRYHSPSDF